MIGLIIRMLSLAVGVVGWVNSATAETLYVSQSGSGDGTGSGTGNRASAAWFNTLGNWGGGVGKVSAGDTVSLGGTINTTLSMQGNGSIGNLITILFESGAKLSQPAGSLMNVQNRSYFVIDGGSDGILENTANGTALANQRSVSGIYASGASNFEIKNLTIKDLYVHTSPADSAVDFTSQGGVYFNGVSGTNSIHNITFSNICWCVNMQGASGVLNLYSNIFQNYDHGFGGGGGLSGLNIYNNHFGSTANWDTTANVYHHDGIHTYWAPGGSLHNARIYNNLFDGHWGINNTAHIFFEQNYNTRAANEATNWWVYNNVHIQAAGNYLNNGFMVFIGNNGVVANNTYIGTSVALQTAVNVSGTNTLFKNNVISGVNRFLNIAGTLATGGLDNNLYAAAVAPGNTPYALNGVGRSTLALWRTATGGDSSSIQVSSAGLDGSGFPLIGSAAINAGTSLAAFYTRDQQGTLRPQGALWDVGAYELVSGSPDVTPPILSPAAASSLSTNSAVITWTSDEAATSIVEYGLSSAYGAVFTNLTLSTSHTVPIAGLTPGTTYHYNVSSADAAGNVATSSDFIFTTLAPDTTAPVVSLTAPASAAVVGGNTTLTATASDDVAVAGVQFMVDGLVIGAEDTAAPYSLVWDTTVVTNGAHIVQALARDTSGNTNTSAAVSFVVQNEIGTNLVNGLVGYWAFEEGKGLRAYPVANYGKEAALLGGASWVAARAGSALLLDGIDGRAEVVDSPALRLNGSLTLALWVKHSTLPALGENMHYLEKGLEDHDNYGFGIGNSAQGMRLYLEFEDSTGAYRRFLQSGNLVLATGVWMHVAVVFDDANDVARFYGNGVEVGSVVVAQSPNGLLTNPIVIGSENIAGWEWYLHGAIDGLRIYNRSLSAAEISAVYVIPPFAVPSLLRPVGP